ncbi:PREDICTED: pre-mRNA-splicing factor 38A-like, partial [Amphimedon queenslandica]|uniref:Pre-mRNA-splicing factor 38 n=2 Tax=Amphimedon queenslandica TaxID=400682 RepID=A0AAN0K2N4_AMPQE
QYWKEKCFALTAELLVDEAMALDYVGGVVGGNIKPTPFLCLILKMLQIQPNKDIVIEFIKNPDYKYVRALGALYLRIVGTSVECYKYLEPLYNDYRKIKYKNRQGKFELSHVDEFVDSLLREDRVCDVILPRIQKRHILEETEQLEPRVSALDDD